MSVDDLANLFFSTRPKDREYYITLFDNLKTIEVAEHSVQTLCKALKRAKVLRSLSEKSYEASEGKKDALAAVKQLHQELENLETQVEETPEFEFITDDLSSLLESAVSKPGLRWRLPSLNKRLGSLRKGDFGFVFARPESGKTTFLCSEVSAMAEQAKQQGLGPVIHFNNEEQHDKVKLRYYQSVLGVPLAQLFANREKADQTYKDKVGGHILLPNITNFSNKQVEKILSKYEPSLIIFDQIDKIQGFTSDRDDLRLGTIYQWARELAKEYGPVIGVTQSDGSGEGVKWLTMGNVANAKTSKQAEADWILGIGKLNESGYERLRFFNVSKNKLLGDVDSDPKLRHDKWEVIIDPENARYLDL